MLSEERKACIVKYINEKKIVSIQELVPLYGVREATIRRDIVELEKRGLIRRVYGGAMSISNALIDKDVSIAERRNINISNKKRIAQYAVGLINNSDTIFIDAGSTTEAMIAFLDESKLNDIKVFTNGIAHARRIAALGLKVFLPPGIVKKETESIVGADTCKYIKKMWFGKCFMGSNGIDRNTGLTTPDIEEANLKKNVIQHSKEAYVLADSLKFSCTSNVSFADYGELKIITDKGISSEYKDDSNVIIVS